MRRSVMLQGFFLRWHLLRRVSANGGLRLCREVQLNLAYRWFCDLSLEDKIPHPTTFSKNRSGRFSEHDLFREMFYQIAEQAIEKGLVRGKHLSTDATLIAADAAMSSLEEIVAPLDYKNYLDGISDDENADKDKDDSESSKFSPKKKPAKKSINLTHSSKTDPDAQVGSRWGSKKKLSYSDNILMDNENRIILDVAVTTPSLTEEAISSVNMVKRSLFRYGFSIEDVGGDSAYSRGESVSGFMEAGVKIYSPAMKNIPENAKGIFDRKMFIKQEDDYLICPNGERLNRENSRSKSRRIRYTSNAKKCSGCPMKEQCTRGAYRVVSHHVDQEALDWAEDLRQSKEYVISQKMRKRIEHLFGEAKEQMGLRRAKRRGFKNMEEQCLMTAMVQNIKRIVLVKPKPGKNVLISTYNNLVFGLENIIFAFRTFLNSVRNILSKSLIYRELIYGD